MTDPEDPYRSPSPPPPEPQPTRRVIRRPWWRFPFNDSYLAQVRVDSWWRTWRTVGSTYHREDAIAMTRTHKDRVVWTDLDEAR